MFQSAESLREPILNVQLLDLYFKDGGLRMENMFFRDEYIYEIEKNKGLLSYYEKSGLLGDDDDDELELYSFDDVLERLVSDLDTYSYMYKVPPLKMENIEWELFFATIANYYKDKEFSYSFINDMIYLNQMAISKAMVYEEDCIDLKTYISSLKYIESDVLSLVNIVEIAKDLADAFGIDTFSLLANEDGSYGCIGKGAEIFILDGEDQDSIEKGVEKLAKELEENGYKINAAVDVNKKEETETKENVVDIKSYKMKQKKRFDNN